MYRAQVLRQAHSQEISEKLQQTDSRPAYLILSSKDEYDTFQVGTDLP